MPPTKNRAQKINRAELVRSITTPLGFYVLALLIVEATLAIVLSCSKLTEPHVWDGFIWMLGAFCAVVLVVSLFAAVSPKNLLYGKEEHSNPALDTSALRDQIEDLIIKNVKVECLNSPAKQSNIKS